MAFEWRATIGIHGRRHGCCSTTASWKRDTTIVNGKLFKALRLGILVYILLMVAGHSWLSSARTTDWDVPLHVGVYPINADGSARSDSYIARLTGEEFRPVADFLSRESARHGIALESPLRVALGDVVVDRPPDVPRDGNVLEVMLWSLHMRYWSWREGQGISPDPDIKVFVLYYDPDSHPVLPHSLGLEKGLVGVVHAFAARQMAGENAFVLAHEVLHTLGAGDKYSPTDNLPIYPDGYAEPDVQPLYPQRRAEVMGGRIPLAPNRAAAPNGLSQVVVGAMTAREIGW